MVLKFSSKLRQVSKNSDLDKLKNWPESLNQSHLEYLIFGLIKIDIISLVKIKVGLSKNFHIAPSEIDKMPMWEYEIYMKFLNESVKEENDQQKKEMDGYDVKGYKKLANPSNLQKSISTPNLSNFSNFKGLK